MLNFEPGEMYACIAGDYSGQYIVPITETTAHVSCLTLPDIQIINVPVDDYKTGIKNELLDKVANVDDEVYTYLYDIYKHESNNN